MLTALAVFAAFWAGLLLTWLYYRREVIPPIIAEFTVVQKKLRDAESQLSYMRPAYERAEVQRLGDEQAPLEKRRRDA